MMQLLDEAAERRAQKLAIAIQRENELREALRVAAEEESLKAGAESAEAASSEATMGEAAATEEEGGGSSRKRRRAQVDYLALDKELSETATAAGDIVEEK